MELVATLRYQCRVGLGHCFETDTLTDTLADNLTDTVTDTLTETLGRVKLPPFGTKFNRDNVGYDAHSQSDRGVSLN